MSKDNARCPNCSKPLSEKIIMLPDELIELIKVYNPQEKYEYCSKCGQEILSQAIANIKVTALAENIEVLKKSIPVLTIHSPVNWNYISLGIVTAQSVIGTGVLSEFTSSLNDLFGKESPAFVKKIQQGEESCFSQIRQKTIQLGGNAIVGVDIDYSEMGSLKGMIMVCMTGTSIKLVNTEILGDELNRNLKDLPKLISEYTIKTNQISSYWAFNSEYPSY